MCRHTLLEYAGVGCFLIFLEKQTLKPYQVGFVVRYASLRQAVTLQFMTCQELAVLINALDQVGCREVKVSEWIRGSNLTKRPCHTVTTVEKISTSGGHS